MIINNCHKRWKEVASTLILCHFACHGVESCSSDITLQWVHGIEFLQLNHEELHAGHIWYTIMCMWKDLQEKGESHLVLSLFECRTAVIFQALIPTLNASQTSGGINLWIWIGESVLQTMQCPLSFWWNNPCIFHSTNVDQTFCLCSQFLTVPQVILTNNDPVWKKFEDSSWKIDFHLNLSGGTQIGNSKKFNEDQLCYCMSNLVLMVKCDDHVLPTGKSPPHTLTKIMSFWSLLYINLAPHLESIV